MSLSQLPTMPPRPAAEIQRRLRAGETPTIAPKILLETPMWIDPRAASLRERYTREFIDLYSGTPLRNTLDVMNPLPAEGVGSESPHGVLRYLDLDVVMSISKSWVESGGGDNSTELEQVKIFEWMGYRNLLEAPYTELRASLKRLQFANIAIGEGGTRPTPFRILTEVETHENPGRGQPKSFRVRLDPLWRQALVTVHDWQAVDLQAYAKLAREYRRVGLARVIYLYLVSHRVADDSFTVPLHSLWHRYAQRDTKGNARRADPLDENEPLKKALEILHKTGVCHLDAVAPAKLSQAILRGRFIRPREPMVIATQQRFVSPGIWDDQPRLVGHSPSDERRIPEVPPVTPPAPSIPPSAERDPVKDSCALINRELRVGKKAFASAVNESGWTPLQVLHLMADVYWQYKQEGTANNPAGLFVAKIRDNPPSHYDMPPRQAWEWLRSSWPALPVFKRKAPPAPAE